MDTVIRKQTEVIILPDFLESALFGSALPSEHIEEVRRLMARSWEEGYKKRHQEWLNTEPFKGMQ